MSTCTILIADPDGNMVDEREFSNSHRGAPLIWQEFAKRYLRQLHIALYSDQEMEQIWALWKSPNVPFEDRITLASTFDYVLVQHDDLERLADCMEYTARWIKGSHLDAEAVVLRELAKRSDVRAVGWQQSSVTADMWYIWDEHGENGRPYNIDRDDEHWWLFEDVVPLP